MISGTNAWQTQCVWLWPSAKKKRPRPTSVMRGLSEQGSSKLCCLSGSMSQLAWAPLAIGHCAMRRDTQKFAEDVTKYFITNIPNIWNLFGIWNVNANIWSGSGCCEEIFDRDVVSKYLIGMWTQIFDRDRDAVVCGCVSLQSVLISCQLSCQSCQFSVGGQNIVSNEYNSTNMHSIYFIAGCDLVCSCTQLPISMVERNQVQSDVDFTRIQELINDSTYVPTPLG